MAQNGNKEYQMARSVDQIMQEQLGGLTYALLLRDAQVEALTDENKKLKEEIEKLKPKEEKKDQ
jgi:cell division protein FtsB